MSIATNLCRLQAERNETDYRLAKELGVKQTSVHNWRTGKFKPLRVYLEKIAEHYGVTVEELTKEDGA